MRISELPEQKAFTDAITKVDNFIAEKRYCPRKYYEQMNRYFLENVVELRNGDREEIYWHVNVPVQDHRDIHKGYYANSDGKSFHLSFEVSDKLSDRNKVIFGSPDVGVRRFFGTEVNKLRRLAKLANDAIDKAEKEYNDTPSGILDALDKAMHKLRNKMENIIEGRRVGLNYRRIQRTSGSDKTSSIYEENRTGEIGRICYVHGTIGFKGAPRMSELIVHFENKEVHAELTGMMTVLEPFMIRMEKVIEDWEAKQIMLRLKGEEPTDVRDTPW